VFTEWGVRQRVARQYQGLGLAPLPAALTLTLSRREREAASRERSTKATHTPLNVCSGRLIPDMVMISVPGAA